MNSTSNARPLYENLDTTFVNLWSLLRNLTQRGFIGRVRVDLEDYSAEVFLNGSSTPMVHEVDHKAGTDITEETALHRVVLRAREGPGRISVFEGVDEATPNTVAMASIMDQEDRDEPQPALSDDSPPPAIVPQVEPAPEFELKAVAELVEAAATAKPVVAIHDGNLLEATIALSGELIGAVERGVNAVGENFETAFDQVRVQLGDDFSFLDPMSPAFAYANGTASLNEQMPLATFVSGVSEALRRVVNQVAIGSRERRVRERIALELLGVARKRKEALDQSKFGLQLDRIAGTKVI